MSSEGMVQHVSWDGTLELLHDFDLLQRWARRRLIMLASFDSAVGIKALTEVISLPAESVEQVVIDDAELERQCIEFLRERGFLVQSASEAGAHQPSAIRSSNDA